MKNRLKYSMSHVVQLSWQLAAAFVAAVALDACLCCDRWALLFSSAFVRGVDTAEPIDCMLVGAV